jgi:hypothetical protein
MKPNKLRLLPLAAAMLVVSPAATAQNRELDMTMTIMEEGQEPEGYIRKIPLPAPAEVGAASGVAPEKTPDRIADEVRQEAAGLLDESVGTVTDNIKDVLSIDGVDGLDGLPGDIVDNLSEELPLLDELPLDLPGGELPQGSLPQIDPPRDGVRDAADAIRAVDKDPVEQVKDAGSEVNKTLEETRKLIP